jgi:RNA polymerase sigma-70 factor (ECF subfamily)
LSLEPEVAHAHPGEMAAGWESLVRQHEQAVFRLAYLLLGDAAEAEDVAQEAFVRAYQARTRFDPARPLRPWLLRITANLAHNRQRAAGRYLAALQRALRAAPAPEPRSRLVESATAEQLAAQDLWRAVRRLPAPDQDVIYLRVFLDLPEAEMAAALEVAAGTVNSRLHRALKRLRAVIEAEYPGLRESFQA